MVEIFVDADACPVKEEIYSVAARHGLSVVVVANRPQSVPKDLGVEMVVVGQGADAADDWIVEELRPDDIVVTADLPLAARCLERGGRALSPTGRIFTEDSIGGLVATRNLRADLRGAGMVSGGPPPLSSKDRSRFRSRLDEVARVAIRGA
ncbi:MAG: hypothetical protein CBC48_00185 [bacterium TMED88]|nr:hypothetical protein [Deltaproteobacteria bacterium]OUV37603.1 MAG: hypothetical protein CBC48_00185 [bacterium TMED88]